MLSPTPEQTVGVAYLTPVRDIVDPGETGSLAGMLAGMLRHRVLILRTVLIGAILAAAVALASPKEYLVDLSFIPQEASGEGGLSALASNFGLALGSSASQSPAFYVELLKTRQILGRLADHEFEYLKDGRTVRARLADILVPDEKIPAIRRRKAVKRLETIVAPSYDLKTGVVNIGVSAPQANLALLICQQVLEEINLFNSETRQSQAHAERVFTEKQMHEARDSLRNAEDRDEAFVTRNRVLNGSPELLTQKYRLDREIGLRQGNYAAMTTAFQRARAEEVRNLPVITLVERPELPPLPEPRGLIVKTILGAIIGGMFGTIIAFVRQSLSRQNQSKERDFEELLDLRRELAGELRHPQRVFRQVFSFGRDRPLHSMADKLS